MNWLAGADFWHWLVLGIVLIALEMVIPGTYVMWLGFAAAIVGVALMVAPELDWQIQLTLFAILSVTFVVASRFWIKRHPIESDQPNLNRRGRQYVGRTFTLTEPIENGQGRLRVDDTVWKIAGVDLAAGTRIRVTDVDGTMLRVERVEDTGT